MNTLSLIANSGIQFHKFQIQIDTNNEPIRPVAFYEQRDLMLDGMGHFQDNLGEVRLQYAYYLPDDEIYVSKEVLREMEAIDENNKIKDNLSAEEMRFIKDNALKEDEEYYKESDIEGALDIFLTKTAETLWIPVPYFKKNMNNKSRFGPLVWARMMIKMVDSPKNKKTNTFKITLAFDTKLEPEGEVYYKPMRGIDTLTNDNVFALCNNEDFTLNFVDHQHHCGWVFEYLQKIYLDHNKREGGKGLPADNFPYMRFLSKYLYLIKYLEASQQFPEVSLFPDHVPAVDVDLVLDIGNANTCGLLFESPAKHADSFKFDSVEKLKIQDLSSPDKHYDQPFSMHLAFAKANFGDEFVPIELYGNKPFQWQSILRLGKEAQRLITLHNIDKNAGQETTNHHSSPKRYLWDTKKAETTWEFVSLSGGFNKDMYVEGLSEQFKENGEYITDDKDKGGLKYLYSRKSLMTFVYIEIFLHTISQINSHEFRYKHKNSTDKPRRLKRITITCPTSIIQHEQVALRQSAMEAIQALSKFFPNFFEIDIDGRPTVHVTPNPKELTKVPKERLDWIYDEATCGQLVFLYAEISQRYLNKADVFFNIYGKKRQDVANTAEKALTIGSIDIGGGTTDVMICAYQYEKGQGQAVIKPKPLYWESFNLAGDDLLKNIVQQVVLEGVIKKSAQEIGVSNVTEKMLSFFGTNRNDQNSLGHMAQVYRKNFITQIALPIALRYLQHASDAQAGEENILTYPEIFADINPNEELVAYFNQHFAPLKLQDIKWRVNKQTIASIVEVTFDATLKQLSVIMSAYGCDFVLLAGRPTTIPKIREILVKYYPVSPERIINLHQYRIGRWYPYATETGYLDDPKTVVAVGALIALMGDKLGKLAGFKINTQALKNELVSTADYMGALEVATGNVEAEFLNPEKHTETLEIHALPITIGYKQLPNKSCKARPIYKLDFNEEGLKEKVQGGSVEDYKNRLKNRMPFKVKIKRVMNESKEKVTIELIQDVERNEMSTKFLSLGVMTLPDENGYWLDTGEFILNID
jgi:hypothetical protein